jgi:Zn ribbon nucleic-acid-binding protein
MPEKWEDPGSFIVFEGFGIICPKCGSDNVVFEETDGYLSFSECKKCGFKKAKLKKSV